MDATAAVAVTRESGRDNINLKSGEHHPTTSRVTPFPACSQADHRGAEEEGGVDAKNKHRSSSLGTGGVEASPAVAGVAASGKAAGAEASAAVAGVAASGAVASMGV